MLQREDSAILSTLIQLPFVFKTIVLSVLEWSLKTDFTVIVHRDSSASELKCIGSPNALNQFNQE